jgi:predicted  nucleic acid-binding Zn-ribbon protein
LDELEADVENRRAEISKFQREKTDLEAQVQGLKVEASTLSDETDALQAEKQQLTLNVKRLEERKSRLQNEITGLQEQGYAPDLLAKIKSVEPRSGPQLWSDLKLASQRHQLKAETQALRQEKTTLECEVKELRDKKEEETKQVRSEENRLDDLRLQAEAVREAVSTVELFYKDGWSAEDLRCLKLGLDLLGLKNEPRPSIARLLKALEQEKSLATLSEKVGRKREELTVLTEACAQLRKDLEVIQFVTVKAIEEARDASVDAIAVVTKRGTAAAEVSMNSIEKLSVETSAQMRAQVKQTIGDLKAELGVWGILQQERGRLEQFLLPARVLFGIIECPDYLNSVPTPMVVQLFERLQAWCELNLRHFLVQPSTNISTRAFNLPSFQSYDLAVLTALVCEGLRLYMIQKSKQAQESQRHEPGGSR